MKKKLINEVKQFQKIAGIIKEYITQDPESVQEAFQQAGVDMSRPVYVIQDEGDKPHKADPTQLAAKLQKIKDTQEETEGVTFDYETADIYPAEQYGLKGMQAKLSVMISDAYEYVIFQ